MTCPLVHPGGVEYVNSIADVVVTHAGKAVARIIPPQPWDKE